MGIPGPRTLVAAAAWRSTLCLYIRKLTQNIRYYSTHNKKKKQVRLYIYASWLKTSGTTTSLYCFTTGLYSFTRRNACKLSQNIRYTTRPKEHQVLYYTKEGTNILCTLIFVPATWLKQRMFSMRTEKFCILVLFLFLVRFFFLCWARKKIHCNLTQTAYD